MGQAPLNNIHRCGTTEAIDHRLQTSLDFKARYQQGIEEYKLSVQNTSLAITENTNTLSGPVTIPIVVHIVLPDPSIVTDDDVNNFIKRLNEDFSGLNADSTNAAPFYNVRGHSLIRFALSRRDPNGNYTTGIERKTGAIVFGNGEPQTIKNTGTGGLNPWPMTDYYNLWVGTGENGLLGIAPDIGPGTAATDGVCIDYRVFSNSPCYSLNSFNLSRTAVHEIGHNFGLYHIFEGACNTITDFGQLTSEACSLPASLLAPSDDTPKQSDATNGCQTGIISTGCGSSTQGKMYQNFMDYTDDACFSMFTKGQVERMHWVLQNCRPGYLTTQGHIPPANAPTTDAAVTAVIDPGGSEIALNNCIRYASPVCEGNISPKIRVTNRGLNQLTTVSVGMQLNEGFATTKNFSINLTTNESAVLSLDAVSLITGSNTLKLFTSLPNNAADQDHSNDTITKLITIGLPVTTPIREGFETMSISPLGWSLFNPDNNFTWEIFSASGKESNASITINNFNHNSPGQQDEIRTPPIITTSIDSLAISFDLAYKNYPGSSDELSVLVSKDCGASFTTVYNKSGSTLATAGATSTGYIMPLASDWKQEVVIVGGDLLSSGKIIVAFRNTNGYGNNIYIDNITIQRKYSNDLQLLSVNDPQYVVCSAGIQPVVSVKNNGAEIITGFKIAYRLNNDDPRITTINDVTLMPGDMKNITLNPGNVNAGANLITTYTYDPVSAKGTGDEFTSNDTAIKDVYLAGKITAPLSEGFENNFPPNSWSIANADNKITWQKAAIGQNSSGAALISNFNYFNKGQQDDLFTPIINYTGIDSIFLKFDLASAPANGPVSTQIDTLEILLTRDCGNSFTSIYKKWGTQLQTINDPSYSPTQEFWPQFSSQWRTDSINLTGIALQGPLQLIFRNTNNNRNNIFIDNVKVFTKTLPARLKQNGFLVLPNPFKNQFAVWYYKQPVTLKFISVFNGSGQLVFKKVFSSNANSFIPIDLTGKPSGIYVMHLGYEDASQNTFQPIIKN